MSDTLPPFRSASYRRCDLCDPPVDCAHAANATAERPCWGDVRIEFEFEPGDHLHACRAHEWVWSDAHYLGYLPEAQQDEWPPARAKSVKIDRSER